MTEYIHDHPEIERCDVIGDVHGCYDELLLLLKKLGHKRLTEPEALPDAAPSERNLVMFVGDLVDRGDRSLDCVRLVMTLCRKGYAKMVVGNHDYRFLRWLQGADVVIAHGLGATIAEVDALPSDERDRLRAEIIRFFSDAPKALRFDHGKGVMVHAAWRPRLKEETDPKKIRYYTLTGPTTGERTDDGFPIRIDWSRTYNGPEFAIFGHQVYLKPYRQTFSCGIDTGCVFGGALTALRYPSLELVSVKSLRARADYNRPMIDPDSM